MNARISRCVVSVVLIVTLALAIAPFAGAQEEDWLPTPTGPYQVGTTFYHWVDESRDELFTDDPNDKRELIVRVWYPAQVPAGATPVTYLPQGETDARYFEDAGIGTDLKITLSAEELALGSTHCYLDVPLSDAEASYPVLIYNAGVPSVPEFGTAQIEELVSHGYVVASINHPYIAGWTVFPDGRVVTIKLWLMSTSFQDAAPEYGAQDQMFVLDQLEMLNQAPPEERFGGRLELDQVGIFGVSWGTWTSALACYHDSRCGAVLLEGTHGYLPPPVSEEGFGAPVAVMNSEGETTPSGFEMMTGPAYALTLHGISGMGYGDFVLWPGYSDEFLPPEARGTVAGLRARQVIDAYALAFFDRHLKGEEALLLDGPSPDFPEVEIVTRNVQ